jgi:DNA invertase Pin-like site-specific DNA recombinase
MKVAIYARVSTEDQDADKQEVALIEYCKRANYEIYKVYKDQAVSGSKTSRPQFDELLKDLRHYKFNCVMVTRLDRLGRSLQHLLSVLNEFNKKGIHFISTTQNIDTTSASGRLQLQILGAFAEFERNLISERTKEGLKRATGVGKRGKDIIPRKRRGGRKNTLYTLENEGGV